MNMLCCNNAFSLRKLKESYTFLKKKILKKKQLGIKALWKEEFLLCISIEYAPVLKILKDQKKTVQ